MEQHFFTSHYGLVSDYLSEALRELRRRSYADAVTQEFSFGSHLNARDEKAVRKTVSGLLKLLHPDERWTRAELREYLELGLEGRMRVKQQLRVLAPHEYARASFSYLESGTDREVFVQAMEAPDDADLTRTDELQVEEEVLEHGDEIPIAELTKLPESQALEFKAAMRYDLQNKGANKALEQVIVKSVAGFMNARGGVLLIGVTDDHEIVGIENDVKTIPGRQDIDGYENYLTTLLENGLSAAAVANVAVVFEPINGRTVCRITVKPSSSPVWTKIRGQGEAFHVRLGNSTRPFGPRDAYAYISQHFRQ